MIVPSNMWLNANRRIQGVNAKGSVNWGTAETRGSNFYFTLWFLILFIYLVIHEMLSTHCMPDSVLGAGNIMGTSSNNIPTVVGVERL